MHDHMDALQTDVFPDIHGNVLILTCSPTNGCYQVWAQPPRHWSVLKGCTPILFFAYVKYNQEGKSAGGGETGRNAFQNQPK